MIEGKYSPIPYVRPRKKQTFINLTPFFSAINIKDLQFLSILHNFNMKNIITFNTQIFIDSSLKISTKQTHYRKVAEIDNFNEYARKITLVYQQKVSSHMLGSLFFS